MSAAPCHKIGNLQAIYRAGESLIVVRVAGEYRMGPNSRRLAGIIDILQHEGTASMRGSAGKGRVMHRDNHRARVILALHTGERRLQEIDLAAVQLGDMSRFGPKSHRDLPGHCCKRPECELRARRR